MQETIERAIRRQARKLLERENRSRYANKKYQRRFRLRTGLEPTLGSYKRPAAWDLAPHFDPLYCIAHAKYISRIIWKRLLERSYAPKPAILHQIPKDSGGTREIMIFSIPDAAVANVFNARMRDRNRNVMSPFCYSYRADRTLFDAVLQLNSYLNADKCYVVQFDFSKYFDNIEHSYIDFLLRKKFFYISPLEEFVIGEFMKHKYATPILYNKKEFDVRKKGVPQGCSLSLFLSNIAAHELDRELENANGMFVRFADDIVCVAYDHRDALSVIQAFRSHGYFSGIEINYKKSPGIALLEAEIPTEKRHFFYDQGDGGEICTIKEFDYIGHKFRGQEILISSRGIARMKRRISRIVYIHLLRALKKQDFNPDRVGGDFYDWDLVTCINEVRNYIYGGLRQEAIHKFLDKNVRITRFKGLMTFYPLVTTVEQFRALDGWLLNILQRALKERMALVKAKTGTAPKPLTAKLLKSGEWYQCHEGPKLETSAPSFVLGWRAARKAFKQYGLATFDRPKYYSTFYDFNPES